MANVSVYNIEGKEVGTIELNDAIFGVEVNEHLVMQDRVLQELHSGQAVELYLLQHQETTLSNLTRKKREQLLSQLLHQE